MKSFKVFTFGCQMNEHDSEKISGVLSAGGLVNTDTPQGADLVVLNTCSIRQKAEQKFYSELGKLRLLKAKNPSLKIAVTGCIAQQEGEKLLKRAPFVDFVLGNQNIGSFSKLVQTDKAAARQVMTSFPEGYEHVSVPAGQSGVRAFVNIMFGCDNFCSYCVVPHVRGREKSRRPGDIVREVERLVSGGTREITLLGQNVNSYGGSAGGGAEKNGFPELLGLLDGVEGLKRIRFVTSHPKDLSRGLVDAMASLPKVCESLHLPLQSASDTVLKAMNRRYTFGRYMEKLRMLREAVPGLTLSTDIIVGFPGETDEDYKKTLGALEDIRYDSIFAFKYSERPNTKALDMPGHLPEGLKAERLDRVLELQSAIVEEINSSCAGKVLEVLVEGPDNSGTPGRLTGRSRGNKIVNFAGDENLIGELVDVRITEGKKHSLVGEISD